MAALILSFNFTFAIGDNWQENCAQMMKEGWSDYGMMDGIGRFSGNNMMDWGGMGGGWGIITMILAIVFWVIIWAVIIVILIALVRWLYLRIFKGELWILGKKETAEEILKLRYAKGEITKEQYESMKKEVAK